MDKEVLMNLLSQIQGCTFATIDAETKPKPGITCRITGERVILFTNKKSSGYDNMVRRRLQEAGKDPNLFKLGDLPWGERIPETPLIYHNGKHYLQTIVLVGGEERFFVGDVETANPAAFGIRPQRPNQGLPPSDAVYVHTYNLDNITRIAVMGEVFENNRTLDKPNRAILRLNYKDVDPKAE